MKLNVFACQDGFLLSAECMLAPREATRNYFPVSAILGIVECAELPPGLCERVAGDIDVKQFSFVGTAEAMRAGLPMLASLHPFDTSKLLHPQL